ncbi:superoxide dismutase [Paenibacillus selenitireducens]|uniref:superoxide dismutase n=1 Tax=Paenibacillus selenitireducens TaxID=1324314 RepID=A0A1T2X6T8_9BACL|nr:Fe-Mn family superoxide dismutase [Paenibacillus selenitireducens]OPA75552.1 superoxide dismutase [Paenibacillus selenitireducens]
MLFVYGALMPLRVLEEILLWKTQEKDNIDLIQKSLPTLEPQYVAWLSQWEQVINKTIDYTPYYIHKLLQAQPPYPEELQHQVDFLLNTAISQSVEFMKQLRQIMESSPAIQRNPLIQIMLRRILQQSEYFILAMQPVVNPSVGLQPAPSVEAEREEAEAVHVPQNHGHTNPAPIQDNLYREDAAEANPDEARREKIWSDFMKKDPVEEPRTPVPIGGHRLPPLPYPYNALEPHIDEMTMQIHHDKHHKTYVDGLNKAELSLADSRNKGNYDFIKYWENELAFNGSGHYLHTLFWDIMSPNGGGKPEGELLEQLNQDYGSYEQFKAQFTAAAEKVEGSGWTILVWSPRSGRTQILQAEKHQNLTQWDNIPLLPLDVWEHAYYLKYQNNRPKYIENWWYVICWPEVAERYKKARQLKWQPW